VRKGSRKLRQRPIANKARATGPQPAATPTNRRGFFNFRHIVSKGTFMKNPVLRFIAAGALTLGFMATASANMTPDKLDGVKLVTAEQARDMLAKGAPLIDTRVAGEYAEKTIKGAISVPYKEKSAKDVKFDRAQDSFDLAKLPADKAAPVVFFCNAGECWKSYKASVLARDAGHKQINWFRGGMPEWTTKGLPTQ
jgi:rhodanese-related sulfurtransferase